MSSLGSWGEAVAAAYLRSRGWSILAKNWRSGHREIDLVVQRDAVIAFVEVKTRRRRSAGDALLAIDRRKQSDLARAASDWIERHDDGATAYRFDAIAVMPGRRGSPEIVHAEDAWMLPAPPPGD